MRKPKAEAEAETKKLGRPPYRTFYTEVTFRLSPHIHLEMKKTAAAQQRKLEDIYQDAVSLLLNRRDQQPLTYHAAPVYQSSRRVTVKMEPALKDRVFAVAAADQRSTANFFETAATLYLAEVARTST